MTWSLKYIEQLKAAGKIRGYKQLQPVQPVQRTGGRIVGKHFKKRSKEKDFIAWNLMYWCNDHAVILEEEYKFHPDRNFRFDWCIPALRIAVEYEGGIFDPNGDHRSVKGISRDVTKYNLAAIDGWKVLRFTALDYKNLINELNKCL